MADIKDQNILQDISAQISPQKDIFDTLYIFAARLISGFFTVLVLFLIIYFPKYSDLQKYFNLILNYKTDLNFYIILVITSYILGLISIVIFDTFTMLINYFEYKTFDSKGKIKNLATFVGGVFSVYNPLSQRSKLLDDKYKNHLVLELAKYFKIDPTTGTTWELKRFGNYIGGKSKKDHLARLRHYFDIFKGICINLAITSYYLFYNKFYFLLVLVIILVFAIIKRLKIQTEELILEDLDLTYIQTLRLKQDEKDK